jgi:predicted transposase YbfD/YdcC
VIVRLPDLNGAVITADALHLHEETIAQIVEDKHGHLLAGLKGNREALLDEVVAAFDMIAPGRIARDHDVDSGHGRIETRVAEVISFHTQSKYARLHTAVRVHRTRTSKKTGKTSQETSYYVATFTPSQFMAAEVQALIRGHWAIENRLHHVKDRTMQEDRCQARANVGSNLALLRSLTVQLKTRAKSHTPRIAGRLRGNADAAIRLVTAPLDQP